MEDTEETVPSRHDRTHIYVNSQRLATCTGPAQIQTRRGPRTEREKWTSLPIPKPEAVSNCHPLAKGQLVFSSRVSLGIQTTLKVRLHAQQANSKPSQWYFCRFFFPLLVFWLNIMISDLKKLLLCKKFSGKWEKAFKSMRSERRKHFNLFFSESPWELGDQRASTAMHTLENLSAFLDLSAYEERRQNEETGANFFRITF